MRSLVILLTVTLLLAGQSEGARLRREAVCSSPTCRDCKESCEGCDKCPLCVLVLPSCNKGQLLPSLGPGVCEKCTKYCQSGPASCRARCEQSKTRQTTSNIVITSPCHRISS